MQIAKHDEINDLYAINGYDRLELHRKADVEAVNYLVKISQGSRDFVTSAKDWGIVSKIFEFWTRRWPEEWLEYRSQIEAIRGTRARKDGYSKELGRGGIRYIGALPVRLMKMIKVIFPLQQWDKSFSNKFASNIQISRVGEKVDTFFTIPEITPKIDVVEEAVKKVKKEKKNGNTR